MPGQSSEFVGLLYGFTGVESHSISLETGSSSSYLIEDRRDCGRTYLLNGCLPAWEAYVELMGAPCGEREGQTLNIRFLCCFPI